MAEQSGRGRHAAKVGAAKRRAKREAEREVQLARRREREAELEAEPTEWELKLRAILWHQNRPGLRGYTVRIVRRKE